jgi:hypothetical protein
MTKALTKREKIARAAEYARTVETVNVAHANLRPGMINVRKNGARLRIVSVNEDVRGIFASRVEAWVERGLATEGGMCYQTVRIDEFGLPDADLVREVEAAQGPTLCVCPPDVAHLTLRIEKSSIS